MVYTDYLYDVGLTPASCALGALVAYAGAKLVYNLFLSPLSGVPGPWYAAVSDIWLLLHAARFIQCDTLHTLFEQYGPIVRVGPRRVVFCDRDTMKSVYCVNKLHKSTFYMALRTCVCPNACIFPNNSYVLLTSDNHGHS